MVERGGMVSREQLLFVAGMAAQARAKQIAPYASPRERRRITEDILRRKGKGMKTEDIIGEIRAGVRKGGSGIVNVRKGGDYLIW